MSRKFSDIIREIDSGSTEIYFDVEQDVDETFFHRLRDDVNFKIENIDKDLYQACKEYERNASKANGFYMGYYICFSFLGYKLCFSPWINDPIEEEKLIEKLKYFGCDSICVREGHFD